MGKLQILACVRSFLLPITVLKGAVVRGLVDFLIIVVSVTRRGNHLS